MKKKILFPIKVLLIFLIFNFNLSKSFGEEQNISNILEILETIRNDVKTLEKAVYSGDTSLSQSSFSSSTTDEDVLTRHLLKLSEIEEEFKTLTNKFEEINFKIDKLSSRISKIQKDNQLRFQDLESRSFTSNPSDATNLEAKIPGTDEPQDLGRISSEDIENTQQVQKIESIESSGTVITEVQEQIEKILPEASPEKQYEFAVSFLKIGDYETAELAFREFIDENSDHKLAGNAQYWYGETFRIRQLYQDAAMAYLDGYQKYPKSTKAPINLLKLGVTLVQIGEKDQGCSMIAGVGKQYPEANQSVLQKAKYEEKKYECIKQKT